MQLRLLVETDSKLSTKYSQRPRPIARVGMQRCGRIVETVSQHSQPLEAFAPPGRHPCLLV